MTNYTTLKNELYAVKQYELKGMDPSDMYISIQSNLFNSNIDDIKNNLSTDEIKELLRICKDSYYNSQREILNDSMFDELESFVGLENKNYIGSKHLNM